MSIAILSALPEEQQGLAEALETPHQIRRGGRQFVQGRLHGHDVVLGLTGIGKVAAATTTTALIEHFGVQRLVLTGVAGGVGAGVEVGDVIVARHFLQHDMDARPLFDRWLVPGYASPLFACDTAMTDSLLRAAQSCTAVAATWQEPLLLGNHPRTHHGLIVSGDQFIVSAQVSQTLRDALHAAMYQPLAVEMEGAAIAQVCADYGTPFAAVRTVSDRADDNAHVDFPSFVTSVASRYAQHILHCWLREYVH